VTKPVTEFTPMKGTRYTHTRCKLCRVTQSRAMKTASGYQPSSSAVAQARRARREQQAAGVLACSACRATKPLAAFVRIRQGRNAYSAAAVRVEPTTAREHAAEIRRLYGHRQDTMISHT